MDELAGGQRSGWVRILNPSRTCLVHSRVVAQVIDYFVILVEQADPSVQVGYEEHLATNIEMGRETHIAIDALGFAVQGQVLQPSVRAISDDELGFTARPVIEPEPMGRLELPGPVAGAAERPDPLGVLVKLVNKVRAVAVRQIEAPSGANATFVGANGAFGLS